MFDHDVFFIVKIASCESGINLQNLWERYRNHGGLSDERAAGDILKLVEQGYIATTVNVTDKGSEYLKKAVVV